MPSYFHKLNILALLLLNPAALFHKINALPWYHDVLRLWSDNLGYQTGDTILEAGCATGLHTQYMARQGAMVLGVDRSSRMLQKAHTTNTSTARFVQANVLSLPYSNNHFNYVIAASLINIVTDPVAAIKEMARVCKPGGTVSVLVPQVSSTSIIHLADALNLSGFSRAVFQTWLHRAPKLNQEALKHYFHQAGLQSISHQPLLGGMVLTVTGVRE